MDVFDEMRQNALECVAEGDKFKVGSEIKVFDVICDESIVVVSVYKDFALFQKGGALLGTFEAGHKRKESKGEHLD